MTFRDFRACLAMLLCLAPLVCAQEQTPSARSAPLSDPPRTERWNLYYQATSIGTYHGTFTSPYSGPFSLQAYPERDVSLTTTLFFGLNLGANTQLYFNPEIAGGRGFSGVDGMANASNGELPRVGSATPKPYIARLFVTHDFGFGDAMENVESDANQLGGTRPATRYTVTIGRFTVTDYFDNNRYSHDPREQFMGWAVMYNGAWDYPADVRGYTWGWVHEYHRKNWSLRYASAMEPKVANGSQFDRRVLRDRGDIFEGEYDWDVAKHGGAVRILSSQQHSDSGNYERAVQLAAATGATPSVVATRQIGTTKWGFGVSADQEIARDVGVFGRLGWNNGKTESFAFTAVDHLATIGVSVNGSRWKRPHDTVASEVTICGLSTVHEQYLAAGGVDFLLGDGALRYGPETVWESYYNARLLPGFFTTLDYQHAVNPAYNRDRGPVNIFALRLHLEMSKDTFLHKPQP